MNNFSKNKIEFLKGVGAEKAKLLNEELGLFTFQDLLNYFPFRHEDRSKIYTIREAYNLSDEKPDLPQMQFKGKIVFFNKVGEGKKKRLVAFFTDGTGEMDLVWFKGIQWQEKKIEPNVPCIIFGKPQVFANKLSIMHPEIEKQDLSKTQVGYLMPVYNTTEKMKKKYLHSKALAKITMGLVEQLPKQLPETLNEAIVSKYNFLSRIETFKNIHYPTNATLLQKAKSRIKFEELFFLQLRLLKDKKYKKVIHKGQKFTKTTLLDNFYENHLPFELTNAQKRVVKEVFQDLSSGKQMNRLLQGDVGSGKTMTAFLAMLIAISNESQVCMVAPTEILAEQHYNGLKKFADLLGITIDILTGSTRTKDRRVLHGRLENGNLKILVGTHAIFEDKVQFDNLGLCVVDEQHRFGVAQRSKLWQKGKDFYPHILVMTATPIPRTLAMTVYGDLDVSVIDELPKGRKPIITGHRYENARLKVFGFLKEEIKKGRQVYIVYPLIEESEKLEYKNLMDGYESVQRYFPAPTYQISIVHGQMSAPDKEYEMQRFKNKETQIMVATTVIEVGVDVPNATVMIIENAERFGLSQLHQLRGRVGRGGEQSYCILMTDYKLSKDGKLRMETMVRTTNGFEIADVDLKMRGPGNLMGTQQSGILDLVMADIVKDASILKEAREIADKILTDDPNLEKEENINIKRKVELLNKKEQSNKWSKIS